MKLGICGICGRMGNAILSAAVVKGYSIEAAIDNPSSPYFGKPAGIFIHRDDIKTIISSIEKTDLSKVDVVIDFSSPSASMLLINKCAEQKKPLVIGTTGFTDEQKKTISEKSEIMPILQSPNMSLGVNLLFKLTEIAAAALDTSYDVEIFEAHHRFKKDAPSGTAKRLVEAVRKMKGLENAKEVTGRDGIVGERSNNEIGVFAMRGGDIVGDHTVFFTTLGERIELTHRASSRDTLARGAVKGAEFLIGRKPGLYNMFDVLGI
jgi:4-hydroxy-tetrahydrodipicolinate reductase